MEYIRLNRNKIESKENLDELTDKNEIKEFLLQIYKENEENSNNFSDYLKELIELLDSKKYTNTVELDFLKKIEKTKNNIKFFVFDKDCTFFENISLAEKKFLQEFYSNNISLELKKAYKISILYTLFDNRIEDFNIIGQCKFSLDEKKNIGEIDSFFINDFWIGYGFGKEFLYKNLNYFFGKYEKINEINLISFDESEDFYKKLGFKVDESKSKILNFLFITRENLKNNNI